MQKFGEMYIATYQDNSYHAKLANYGTPSIWVGYYDGNPNGTYLVFSLKTKKIILMTFSQKSYGD